MLSSWTPRSNPYTGMMGIRRAVIDAGGFRTFGANGRPLLVSWETLPGMSKKDSVNPLLVQILEAKWWAIGMREKTGMEREKEDSRRKNTAARFHFLGGQAAISRQVVAAARRGENIIV